MVRECSPNMIGGEDVCGGNGDRVPFIRQSFRRAVASAARDCCFVEIRAPNGGGVGEKDFSACFMYARAAARSRPTCEN